MSSQLPTNQLSSTEAVDIIEKIVYDHLKPLGFRKHGRTLHRFVDGDISQVVNFQNGCPEKGVLGVLWINLGIRIPECAECTFNPEQPLKKYYPEYQCDLRNRLDELVYGKEHPYDLREDPYEIGKDVLAKLIQHVLPVYDRLNSRDAILEAKTNASSDRFSCQLRLFETAMIYGRRGDLQKATELFLQYYQNTWDEYLEQSARGYKRRLKKGEKITYFNRRTNQTETVVAEQTGYVRIFHASTGHLEYLESLAEKLGIPLPQLSPAR